MSTDPSFERTSILLRAQSFILGGRVYDSVPDDFVLERNGRGVPKPYAVIHYGTVYATAGGRSLMGEAEQPHVQPFTVQCFASTSSAAQASAGAVRDLFVGWTPSPGSDEIQAPGGSSFRDKDSGGTPSLFTESVSLEFEFNLGPNEGYVPTPGEGPDGGESIETIRDIVLEVIGEVTHSFERKDFPNPVGSWPMVHALGRIPSVTLYSLSGMHMLSDYVATDTTVLVTWADPTAGFAILN